MVGASLAANEVGAEHEDGTDGSIRACLLVHEQTDAVRLELGANLIARLVIVIPEDREAAARQRGERLECAR